MPQSFYSDWLSSTVTKTRVGLFSKAWKRRDKHTTGRAKLFEIRMRKTKRLIFFLCRCWCGVTIRVSSCRRRLTALLLTFIPRGLYYIDKVIIPVHLRGRYSDVFYPSFFRVPYLIRTSTRFDQLQTGLPPTLTAM